MLRRALHRVLPVLVVGQALVTVHAAGVLETPGSEGYRLPTPHARSVTDQQIYPPEAVQRGIEGRVLAAFDITTEGRVANVSILWTEDPLLADATRRALSAYHFEVPGDWGHTGVRRRWRMGFVYCLAPSGQPGEFALPVPVTTIKVSRRSGVPVQQRPAGGHPSKVCAS